MGNEVEHLESLLTLGNAVIFQPDPHLGESLRYASVIRGWRKLSHILLDRPTLAGRLAAHRENQHCVIRFLHEGIAYAFESRVVSWNPQMQKGACRIEWPTHLDAMSFRRHERVRIQLSCRVAMESGTLNGLIEDISLGGCRICSPKSVAQGSKAQLSFSLPDGAEINSLECIVRNARREDDKIYLGCEFVPGQAFVETAIASYMANALERSGKRPTGLESILIVDSDPERAAGLRALFEGCGYGISTVTQTLDALVRLRVTHPSVVLINEDQTDLPGRWMAHLVKLTPGFETSARFIYNYPDTNGSEQARLLGLAGIFPAATPLADIASTVVQYIQSHAKSNA